MSTRLDDRAYTKLMNDENVQKAMRLRCEEVGHDWVSACTAMFQIYSMCKWCGEIK